MRPHYLDHSREPPIDAPVLDDLVETGVAIIGGGLAGLAVALPLVERGVDVVLLEAGEVGAGASGRNGGFVQLGWAKDDDALIKAAGPADAQALFDLARDAVDLVRQRIEHYRIDCDPVAGVIEASWFGDDARLAEQAALAAERHGVPFRHLPAEELQELYRTRRYRGGILDPVSFHADPLALVRGYARAAQGHGLRLFQHSPALKLSRGPDGEWLVGSRLGAVRAQHVVLAGSAYGLDPDGRLRRVLLPVISYVLATEAAPERLGQVIRAPYAVFDDRFATGYWRPLADGQLIWGGRIGMLERPPGLLRAMRRDLGEVFPELADLKVEALWSGRMAFTRHRMPLVRALEPGLWTSSGFCGHGLGTTTAAGEVLAGAIVGDDDRIGLFDRFRPSWAGGPFGPLAAQLVYHGMALKDRWRGWRTRSDPAG